MRFQEPLTEKESEALGREVFELWLNLGTMAKMNQEYRRRHPDKEWVQDGVQGRRAKHWWVENTQEGIEMMKKKNPAMPEFMIQQKVFEYALVFHTNKYNFLKWVDKNPWAKQYEDVYTKFYVE
jgi:hypothetical protein